VKENQGGLMATKVIAKQYKRVDLVEVSGRIDSSSAPQLDQALGKIIHEGRYRIVVDLSETDFMSSAGLRVLISALKQARRFNRGDLRLAGLTSKVKKAFQLAGFDELFQIFENSVDAVGSF
jgi:anti-sigma B factor antagonist